jgi:hypothetical protein
LSYFKKSINMTIYTSRIEKMNAQSFNLIKISSLCGFGE